MMDRHIAAYKEEAYELLADLQSSLMELEESPEDAEIIGRVFRAMHTIKGSGAMFGFDDIAKFTHEVETVFDLVRNGDLPVTRELIDLTLAARDQIKAMLDSPSGGEEGSGARAAIIGSLRNLASGPGKGQDELTPEELRRIYSVLSEFELSRLRACRKSNRDLYTVSASFTARNLTEQLEKSRERIKGVGELVSSVPAADAGDPGAGTFTFLLASALDAASLTARLDASPRGAGGLYALLENEDTGKAQGDVEATYRIRFAPHADLFSTGTNPLLLLQELREMGNCRVIAHTDSIPALEETDPESCYTYWDVILTTDKGKNAVKDVFIFVEDSCRLSIDEIDREGLSNEEANKRIGDILIEKGELDEAALKEALKKQKRIGELLVEGGAVGERQVESALAEQKHIKEAREKRLAVEASQTIRVPSDRLDALVNLVGELVTVQARLSQTSASRNDAGLLSIAEEVERLTSELRDNTMSLRMLPIGTTFSKFRRLVRDLSGELGREVEMTTDGAETELDKTVIEKLNDPLVHLIRNSIDHGIEPPDVRESAGKPRKGTIHLSAEHSGANVLIRIRDDGAGLDAEAIYSKAVERGLIQPDAGLSEKEIFSLILAPGFSTAKKVTSVSGRGVGMDVVKKAIDSLKGTIEISSTRGAGTTMTLKLPLTLAIIEGLLVEIGTEFFIFPLSAVEECVELTAADSANASGHLANVRGQIVPYIRLREQFAINGSRPPIEQIVIAGLDGQKVGFVVDNVVGEHQTVIKTLGKVYKDIEGISGATILGDGTVALILDIPKLFLAAEQQVVV